MHGTPGDATNWGRYLPDPPAGLELVALDRPGFGESEPKRAVPSLERQVAALVPALVEAGGDRRPILVGHSLGGPIILRAASDHPDLVGGLVVLAGNVDPELEKLRWYNYAGAVLQPFLSRDLRNSNDELFDHREELEELVSRLDRVRCPVLIAHGTEDELVPYANAVYLADALPEEARTELVTLEGGDHFFIWSRPEVVWEAIEALAGEP